MTKVKNLWNKLLYAGADGLPDHEHKKSLCLAVNLLCLVIFLADIITGPIFYFVSGKVVLPVGCLCEAITVSAFIGLNYFRKYDIAVIGFYLLVNIATFYFGSLLGKAAEAQLMIVFLIGLVLFLFEETGARIICIGLTIMVLILMELNFKYQFLIKPIDVTESITNFIRWMAYIVIISLIIVVFYLYAKSNKMLLEKIKEYANDTRNNLEKEKKSNQVKVTYIHNAYHEVRSSLFGVFVIIQLLEKNNIGSKKEKHIGHLRAACENLKMVINNMLSYSKFEVGYKDKIYLEHLNLRPIFGSLVEIGQYAASKKQVKITLLVSKDIPDYVLCDRVKLTQISTNLINNAIKFSRAESEILVSIEREAEYWTLSVRNEGPGISSDRLATIFNAFSTDRANTENQEGLGLGLHITNQLVGLLKGQVKVESKVDCYTCFTITLPTSAPAEDPESSEKIAGSSAVTTEAG